MNVHTMKKQPRIKYHISSHLKYVIVLSGKRVHTHTDRQTDIFTFIIIITSTISNETRAPVSFLFDGGGGHQQQQQQHQNKNNKTHFCVIV